MTIFLAAAWLGAVSPAESSPPSDWLSERNRDHRLAGLIWDSATGQVLSPEELIRRLARSDYVLLGEVHDNWDHHRLQAWVIAGLVEAGHRPSVAWEMLDWDAQPRLDAYAGDAAGLGEALEWADSGWPEWSAYAPIAEAALSAGLPQRAANLPKARMGLLARGGLSALDPEERRRSALDEVWPEDFDASLLDELEDAHCGLVPRPRLTGMASVQRARDGAMAAVMVEERADGRSPVVLIAGAGHVRPDRGVPWYLRALDPGSKSLSLSFVEVSDSAVQPGSYAGGRWAGQILWFTPAAERPDPCEQFRERLESQRE